MYYHTEYRILSCIEKSRSALQIFFHFEETGMGGWGLIHGRTIFERRKIFVVLVFIYNMQYYIVSVPVHYSENTCVNYNYFAIRNLKLLFFFFFADKISGEIYTIECNFNISKK